MLTSRSAAAPPSGPVRAGRGGSGQLPGWGWGGGRPHWGGSRGPAARTGAGRAGRALTVLPAVAPVVGHGGGASGSAGVGAGPAAAATGRHRVSAVAPSPAFIGARQLGAGGGRGGGPGGPGGGEVRAEVLSPRAGRAGRGQRPRLRPLRWERLSRGRARVPGRHRPRAPGGAGLRGVYAHPLSRARSPVAAPTVRPRAPRLPSPAHCDRIPGCEPSGPARAGVSAPRATPCVPAPAGEHVPEL